MNIQDRLRASSVKRWHIVNTSREQSMAEHAFNVAQIAIELRMRLNPGIIKADCRADVLLALDHDMEEILEGDIPTNAKPNRKLQEFFEQRPWDCKHYVKMADLIDMCVFIEDYGIGRHAKAVSVYCWNLLEGSMIGMPAQDRGTVKAVVFDITEGQYQI